MARPAATSGFAHVETWVFDLDNTLYPADCNLFAQIDRRMGEFIANSFGIPYEDAQKIRERYYYEHGTTLAGLMRLHDICPHSFLDYVHDIDLSVVAAAPELGDAIANLPGRKFIFTNGSRKHAEAVVRAARAKRSFRGYFRYSCARVHLSEADGGGLRALHPGARHRGATLRPCSTTCRTISKRRIASA